MILAFQKPLLIYKRRVFLFFIEQNPDTVINFPNTGISLQFLLKQIFTKEINPKGNLLV